jgi:hypothetical protein
MKGLMIKYRRGMIMQIWRSGRIVKKPAYLENYALSAMSYSDDVPQNYTEIRDL